MGLILSKDCSFAITKNTTMGEKCPNTVFFWSEYSKIQARQNSVSGHFSHRAMVEKDVAVPGTYQQLNHQLHLQRTIGFSHVHHKFAEADFDCRSSHNQYISDNK